MGQVHGQHTYLSLFCRRKKKIMCILHYQRYLRTRNVFVFVINRTHRLHINVVKGLCIPACKVIRDCLVRSIKNCPSVFNSLWLQWPVDVVLCMHDLNRENATVCKECVEYSVSNQPEISNNILTGKIKDRICKKYNYLLFSNWYNSDSILIVYCW